MVVIKWSAQRGNMQEKMTTGGAHKVFDRMPSFAVQQQEVPNCIHEVMYPMTNEVLHVVFDPYSGERECL
jgi:hypothetical protein